MSTLPLLRLTPSRPRCPHLPPSYSVPHFHSSQVAPCSSQLVCTPPRSSPLLLDAIPPLRSLVWQYMDNRLAVHYLSTCKQLRGLYHTFPLTEPVSHAQFAAIAAVGVVWQFLTGHPARPWKRYRRHISNIQLLVTIVGLLRSCEMVDLPRAIVLQTSAATVLLLILPFLFPPRSHCCKGGRLLSRFRRQKVVPRIIRMADWCALDELAYLQHAEEVYLVENPEGVRIDACKLPRTLRRLALSLDDYCAMKADTLPPQLTALAMTEMDDKTVLQPGGLPQSLIVFVLFYKATARHFIQPIAPRRPTVATAAARHCMESLAG